MGLASMVHDVIVVGIQNYDEKLVPLVLLKLLMAEKNNFCIYTRADPDIRRYLQ